MRINWNNLKKFIDDNKLVKFLNYVELDTCYYIWIYYEGESFLTMLDKGSQDCQVFIVDYKPYAVLKNDLTDDGMKYSRTVFVGKSRMMHCLFTRLTTSLTDIDDETHLLVARIRNAQGEIIQESSQAVYTEIDFCPGSTTEYGLYGGAMEALESLETDFFASAILAPDIPAQYGGQLYFIRNRLLTKPRENFERHAINVGDIQAGVVGANVMRIQIKHDMGIQKRFQIEIQYYI